MQEKKTKLSKFPDSSLVELLRRGDEQALQAILSRYWEPLFKMAAHTLDDLAICEDIVQELFIRLWHKREELVLTHSLKAYLFAAMRYDVYRQIKLQLRKEAKMSTYEQTYIEHYNPENRLEYNELMRRVESLVEQLPDRCREIYRYSRDENLSHKEIASQLNVSEKTVENQIAIALRRIRAGIKNLRTFLLF